MDRRLSDNQITIYETDDGKARVEMHFEDENVWLTQAHIPSGRDQRFLSQFSQADQHGAKTRFQVPGVRILLRRDRYWKNIRWV